MHMLACRWS